MASWGQVELEALYVDLEKPLYNVVYRLVWDAEQARDVVQEAFVKLWSMRRRVRAETVEALVYRIALNLARSQLRRRRVLRWLSLEALAAPPADPREPERDALVDERTSRLREAIGRLPEELRAVVLLTAFTPLGYDAIGEALGVPAGTVGSRRNRALRELRRQLGETFALPEPRRDSGEART